MALTARKKKGIGFLISGGVFIGMGVAFILAPESPAWLEAALTIIGFVASTFGFTTVFPDIDK